MIWKINHVVETDQVVSGPRPFVLELGITETSLLNTRCNVCSVPTTISPRICLSDLMRSAHCRSMRRWTLNGYMALIRSTSLTGATWRISLRRICVLSVDEVAGTRKVPGEVAKSLVKFRECRVTAHFGHR